VRSAECGVRVRSLESALSAPLCPSWHTFPAEEHLGVTELTAWGLSLADTNPREGVEASPSRAYRRQGARRHAGRCPNVSVSTSAAAPVRVSDSAAVRHCAAGRSCPLPQGGTTRHRNNRHSTAEHSAARWGTGLGQHKSDPHLHRHTRGAQPGRSTPRERTRGAGSESKLALHGHRVQAGQKFS